ncbi:unnamed protein product [Hymenolepis diminuta]|uniref:Uncharacterized protein n=1 Tax=Hymenolepis diminuta TaxID=6216 RepID=A0A564YXV1_HYMDI|nr:unnamed protein product [Hymenolepis diminuta]
MSIRPHRFLPFYDSLVSPKKCIYVPCPNDSYKTIFFSAQTITHAYQLLATTLLARFLSSSARSPLYLSLASILVVAYLNIFLLKQLRIGDCCCCNLLALFVILTPTSRSQQFWRRSYRTTRTCMLESLQL